MRVGLGRLLVAAAMAWSWATSPGGAPAQAAEVTASPLGIDHDPWSVSWGGFVDTNYLFDFNRPAGLDRALVNGSLFATTGERTNEFNINLAYFEAKIRSDRVRGRLALQAGTSVQANYRGEGAGLGLIQGAWPAELIQEAVVGYRLGDGLWIDAGVFFSHLGLESFISRDNWTYTRSLIAEFSPYYESGAKITYEPSSLWTLQLLIVNGWQNMAETNTAKSLGMAISYAPSARWSLAYNNYVGEEPGSLLRFYHDFIARVTVGPSLQVAINGDVGTQANAGGGGSSTWYGGALLGHWQLSPRFALVGRLERYSDGSGVIVPTGTPHGFAVTGGSVNLDAQLHKNLLWRNELRALFSDQDAVFTSISGPSTSDQFAVSSLALSF